MNCFPCCGPKKSNSKREHGSTTPHETIAANTSDMKKQKPDEQLNHADNANLKAQHFTFRELATATKNFRQECVLGEGVFGRVYRGTIPATGQAVAVKQLDRHGTENSKEFLSEFTALSLLQHENLVSLIGYCADGDQRLLVYDFVLGCTLEDRLLENKTDQPPLNWYERMKVAAGASKGLQYLHDSANPPVIYGNFKASNILLGNDLDPRLMDFGMSKISGADKMNNAPPRVMGTYGYCAPEYARSGQLTFKSDVYSFGVVLLELITGRRVIDTTRPNEEQNLVSWAQPLFRDPKRYPDMADPVLNKQFPEKDLNQAVAIAAMCLQEEAEARPYMSDVVTALSFLSIVPPEGMPPPLPPAPSVSKACGSARESEYESESVVSESESESDAESDKESHNGDGSDCEEGENERHGSKSHRKHVFSIKSSRKSSTRSRKGTLSSDSGDGSISSSFKSSRKSHGEDGNISKKTSRKSSVRDLSQKSSRKSSPEDLSQKSSKKSSAEDLSQKNSRKSSSKELSQKSSRKPSSKELSQKSSRKSSIRDLSHKMSGKTSIKALSHKSSKRSEDGSISRERRASSHGSSSHHSSSVSESVHSDLNSSSRRTEGESIQLHLGSSMGSDEGSGHPFDYMSSNESGEGSVYSH